MQSEEESLKRQFWRQRSTPSCGSLAKFGVIVALELITPLSILYDVCSWAAATAAALLTYPIKRRVTL